MLIDIDHVAISSMNLHQDIETMKAFGYQLIISEKNLVNLDIKRNLMKKFSKFHDLTLLNSFGNFGIEFINYDHVNKKNGYIIPIFENVPPEFFSKNDIIDPKNIMHEIFLKNTNIQIYVNDSSKNPSFKFNKILIKTSDVKKSINFFKCLGFTEMDDKNKKILKFQSLFQKSLFYIYLEKSKNENNQQYFLDDFGFNCLAFISNSAKNEKEKLHENGYYTTEIRDFFLNNKLLKIFFAKSDQGEIVEIISIENISTR